MRRCLMAVLLVVLVLGLGLRPQTALAWSGEGCWQEDGVVQPGAGRRTTLNSAAATRLLVSLRYPITGQGGMQTVSVSLVGSDGRGVAGVLVRISVKDNRGIRYYTAGPTNAGGRAVCTFPVGQAAPGSRVVVEALAIYRGVAVRGSASYLVGK